MRRLIGFNRLLLAGIVTAAAVLSLTQVAQAGPPAPVVPSNIQVPDANKVFLVGHAIGVQIYSCNGVVWGFVAPRANLYNDHGTLITTHFAGPTWQAKDGSKAMGQLVDFVTLDPTAIPWLLLSASTTPDPDGDRLVATTYIQRIATTGGLAPPAAECNATTAGTVAESHTPPTTTSGSTPGADATALPRRTHLRRKPQPTGPGGSGGWQ